MTINKEVEGNTCNIPTIEIDGLRIPLDTHYIYNIDGYTGELHASPTLIEEAITGHLLQHGVINPGDFVKIEKIEKISTRVFNVTGSIERSPVRPKTNCNPMQWKDVVKIYADFSRRSSKKSCPYAAHISAIYVVDEGPIAYAVDVSRHSSTLKLAGILSRKLRFWEPKSNLIAVTTGRVSSDMVAALQPVGICTIISGHRPLYSGLIEAMTRGITLILKSPNGKELAVYTGHDRILDPAPRVKIELTGLETITTSIKSSYPLC